MGVWPVERTERFVTTVPDLGAAWQFVMSYVDRLGPDPRIVIGPFWSDGVRWFTVEVSGMQEVGKVVPG